MRSLCMFSFTFPIMLVLCGIIGIHVFQIIGYILVVKSFLTLYGATVLSLYFGTAFIAYIL